MQETLTVRLSDKEQKALSELCALSGKSRSEVVREALRVKLFQDQFARVRAVAVPRAQLMGILTEEDAMRAALASDVQ
jgi:predicted transcriptional regulator